MTFPFDAHQGLIIVRPRLWGPMGNTLIRFALDAGASKTMIDSLVLFSIGHDPALSSGRVYVTTGSGTLNAPVISIERLQALGREPVSISRHRPFPAALDFCGLRQTRSAE